MRVTVDSWTGRCSMGLEDALTPDSEDRHGIAESAAATARACQEAIGRLLAALVERRVFTIEEAKSVARIYADITPAGDDEWP